MRAAILTSRRLYRAPTGQVFFRASGTGSSRLNAKELPPQRVALPPVQHSIEKTVLPRPYVHSLQTPSDNIFQYPYPEDITISEKSKATSFALETYSKGAIPRCLVFWADGSHSGYSHENLSSGAIGYHSLKNGKWQESVTISITANSSTEAELLAIREAFREAALTSTRDFDRLLIFSDSMSMLQSMKNGKRSSFKFLPNTCLIDDIFRHANEMHSRGIQTELYWVPGKASVEGHRRVDKIAGEYRQYTQISLGLWLHTWMANIQPIRIIPMSVETQQRVRVYDGQGKEVKLFSRVLSKHLRDKVKEQIPKEQAAARREISQLVCGFGRSQKTKEQGNKC